MSGIFAGLLAGGGASGDASWSYVAMLMSTTATNAQQNNTFLDGSTNNFTITRNGNTTQGSVNPYGPDWSNYFDGSGDYLTAPYSTGLQFPGDFTVECWVFPIARVSTYPCIVNNYSTYTTNGGFSIFAGHNLANTAKYQVAFNGSFPVIQSTDSIVYNSWAHIALVRSGSTITLYVNGVANGTATSSATVTGTANSWWVGTAGDTVSDSEFNGYISNLRAVKGTAVYTGAFTPSTTPLTAISGTGLLTCQSGRFIDNSSNNATITVNGNTSVTPFSPFSPGSPGYTTAANGGSGYFDGSGDYLTAPYSVTNSEWWTQDFTMEMWVYNNTNAVSGTNSLCLQLAHGIPAAADTYWSFGTNASGQVDFYYFNGAGVRLTGTTAAPLSAWNHIAMVYTHSSANISLYLNGSRVATGTKSGTPQNSSGSTINVGVAQNTFYNGYISNLRILDGTAAYSGTTYTVPTSPVTAITNTSLLLNFTNAGIFDSATINNMETVGNAQVSTTQAKFGTTSVAFDGSGDYLVVAANATNRINTTGNFTIEFWAYFNSVASNQRIIAWDNDVNNFVIALYTNSSGNLAYYVSSNGTSWNIAVAQTVGSISTGTWYHVAFVRNGSEFTPYLNGVAGTVTTSSATLYSSTLPFVIGATGAGTSPFNGYIDDLRITNGVARYTTTFTPPTQAFPPY
jgi:hypothetical protein